MAYARTTDLETSHIAAKEVEVKGTAATHRAICLNQINAIPGQTSAEIAAMTGLDRHQVARRLPELRKAGLIENGGARLCRVVKSKCTTWYAKA